MTMKFKLQVMSDLHLEHFHDWEYLPVVGSGDILILAGDILNAKHFKTNGFLNTLYQRFIETCSKNYERILYVFGNHEFYGYNYEGAYHKIKEYLPDNFHVMENDTIQIGDWSFIGATFWTNFRNANPIEMLNAETYMNDYKCIRIGSNYRKLLAKDTLGFHNESRDYILNQLDVLKDNVFLITHHAPSYQSISEQYKNDSCNSSFCSDYDGMILNHPQIKYFVHGHVHTAFDYMIGDCRVICNPRGYSKQNTGYNEKFYLKI
jgi:Icc-related predicted phosphoesterase